MEWDQNGWAERSPANTPSWYVGTFISHPIETDGVGFLPVV